MLKYHFEHTSNPPLRWVHHGWSRFLLVFVCLFGASCMQKVVKKGSWERATGNFTRLGVVRLLGGTPAEAESLRHKIVGELRPEIRNQSENGNQIKVLTGQAVRVDILILFEDPGFSLNFQGRKTSFAVAWLILSTASGTGSSREIRVRGEKMFSDEPSNREELEITLTSEIIKEINCLIDPSLHSFC